MKITLDFDPCRNGVSSLRLPAVVHRSKKGRDESRLILDPNYSISFDSEHAAICYFIETYEDLTDITLSIY